jgi:Domain of unknown function (DUF4194)
MQEQTTPQAPDNFAPIAIKLLQGVIYEEDTKNWQELVKVHELPLRRYFAQIGMELIVDKVEGFAFLRQPKEDQEETAHLPRLMRKRSLNFDQSVLCVLLRERLDEHAIRDTASREPIMTLRDIRDMVELFSRERNTQQRFLKDLKKTVDDVKNMGFLESVGQEVPDNDDERRYRVRRILKAFIDADSMTQLLTNITTSLTA